MVLSIIGWFFLGLLALLVLFFVLPITIKLELRGGVFSVWVRVLCVRLRVLPRPDKPKKEKKPKKKKKDAAADGGEAPKKKEKKKRSFGEMWALMKRLAAAGLVALGTFFRHLRIGGVRLVLPVHAEDAADTAVRYGQLQAAIGGVRAFLDGRLHIRYKKLVLIPDFTGQQGKALFFACNIRLCPGIIFVMLFRFLVRFLRKRPYSKKAYKQAVAQKRAAAGARRNGQDGGTRAA